MTAEQLDLLTLLPATTDCHTCGQPAALRLHTEINLLLRHSTGTPLCHSTGTPLCHNHAATHSNHPHVPHWVSYARPLTPGQPPPDWPVLGWRTPAARPSPPNCRGPWTFEEPDSAQLRNLCGPKPPRPTRTVQITGSYL